jgi:2-polyprenyl-3-methyl-5-hydroxy-6-metoxy-1,4-benzoquinol methylase
MADLAESLAKYEFYHIIDLGNGLRTKGYPSLVPVQAPVLDAIGSIEMAGKSVLDIGCRDGLFCFEAERRGASRILGIDNNLSPGAVEVLIPHFGSKVQMREVNLYDFASDERFDVVIFAGVLYHLRFPAFGLKRIADAMAPGGTLIIETGMLLSFLQHPFIFTPAPEESPYDPTSVTFFNERALISTLESLGLSKIKCRSVLSPSMDRYEDMEAFRASKEFAAAGPEQILIGRATYVCQRAQEKADLNSYWYGVHNLNTDPGAADEFLKSYGQELKFKPASQD